MSRRTSASSPPSDGRNSVCRPLGRDLADDLRTRILGGEFGPGDKLPSETDLAAAYGVARVTVRTALQLLQSRGLAYTRHGSGTYVAPISGDIRAGLQELRSITDVIRELGHEPAMRRHRRDLRPSTPTEAERLALEAGELLWSVERSILADGEAVAYSHDLIPAFLVPEGSVEADRLGEHSVFAALQACGVHIARAVAAVHAVDAIDASFVPDDAPGALYLLLDQVHETRQGRPVLHSRTYFVEGRFQFVILRTR